MIIYMVLCPGTYNNRWMNILLHLNMIFNNIKNKQLFSGL